MRKLYLLAIAALLPCSGAGARPLTVTPQQVERLGIKLAPVRVAGAQTTVSVLGRVTPAPGSQVPVSAPFAGTVKSLVRLEGSSVQKGDTLAIVISADMSAAHARLQGQEANYRSAKAAADRANALVREGIAPASRAEEANAAASAAAADLASSRSVMTRASRSEEGGYQLLAPAAGRVARLDVSAGDQVSAMQLVALIDTRQEMWVEGALPASAIGRVAAGDHVVLEGAGLGAGDVVGHPRPCEHRAVLVDGHRLHRGGADVDPDRDLHASATRIEHGCQTRATYRPNWSARPSGSASGLASGER